MAIVWKRGKLIEVADTPQQIRNRQIRQVQSKARTVNSRMKSIEKYTGRKDSYATKEWVPHAEKLNMLTKSNRVRLDTRFYQNLSQLDLDNVERMLNRYLNNYYSKVSNIKENENRLNNMLQDEYDLTSEEAEALQELLTEEGSIYEIIDPSDLWKFVNQYKVQKKNTFEDFKQIVKKYYDTTANNDLVYILEDFYNNVLKKK